MVWKWEEHRLCKAEAAGIAPCVEMNPILLKPTSDVGSQVIVNGTPFKNMPAKEYFQYKKKLIPDILKAYDTLDRKYDVIVLEGAGSPAEINLKKDDIVNMGMAELVDAPVLLVGDIDRGGVFAQLVGTIMLLEEKERTNTSHQCEYFIRICHEKVTESYSFSNHATKHSQNNNAYP